MDELIADRRFTGQREDGTGLVYMNARYYDPAIGQFISPDTLVPDPGRVFGYNRYMYTYGNPLRYTDPTGHCSDSKQFGVGWAADYSGDNYEDGCDPDWQLYASGKRPPSLGERLAPDVVIIGVEGEVSVIATLNGGRYVMYDYENLRKVTANGFGGGISLPSVSVQRVRGFGYYQSNDPVFEDPDMALSGNANETSVSGGELLTLSATYGSTERYVDDPENALRYFKNGVGLGAGTPVNASWGGSRTWVRDVQEFDTVGEMRVNYVENYGSDSSSFLQRFRQPEDRE